ncbi:MAG: 3-deoxy-7-phosphoheptulonate synthase class II [Candidatus Sumerlaeia bacterium]|nr:3-deoxy-7-phosphoheptulonate synthase class II [Candidatus Sumerlaeia bacterium]
MTAEDWSPTSWLGKPAEQSIDYPDPAALAAAVQRLHSLPPLVTSWEIERLRQRLAEAALGKRFLLQGGDCAETFDSCAPDQITNKLKILLQMSLVLSQGIGKPIIRVGRFAGQYAKPRTSLTETIGGETLPSYFGDLVNSPGFTPEARRPDPQRLLDGYAHASMTLNFIRALMSGGFADLHHPEYWDLAFLERGNLAPAIRDAYLAIRGSIASSIDFIERICETPINELHRVEFYTSHEGLHLPYESALTRRVPRREGHYNLGCHLPWIGERTRQADGAHIEYFRGIRNPLGVKIGPKATPDELLRLADTLDPGAEPGRLLLICRFGAGKVEAALPPLLEAMRASGRRPVWVCDPMHGNTITTASGRKTRPFESIAREVQLTIDLHRAAGSVLGGVHFELTGDKVAECIGGASQVTEADLASGYESPTDPRLNYEQSMELAFAISERMNRG